MRGRGWARLSAALLSEAGSGQTERSAKGRAWSAPIFATHEKRRFSHSAEKGGQAPAVFAEKGRRLGEKFFAVLSAKRKRRGVRFFEEWAPEEAYVPGLW